MLKYVDTKVVFREIPDHITLAVNISGCPCACEGCHSSYLAGDIGEVLSCDAIRELISRNDSISCISFMGGDSAPAQLSELAKFVKDSYPKIATAWYSGRDVISSEIDICNFDYIKIGSYQSAKGALDSPTTNQRLYHINESGELLDITYRMRRGSSLL